MAGSTSSSSWRSQDDTMQTDFRLKACIACAVFKRKCEKQLLKCQLCLDRDVDYLIRHSRSVEEVIIEYMRVVNLKGNGSNKFRLLNTLQTPTPQIALDLTRGVDYECAGICVNGQDDPNICIGSIASTSATGLTNPNGCSRVRMLAAAPPLHGPSKMRHGRSSLF